MNHTALKDKLQNEIDSMVGKNSDIGQLYIAGTLNQTENQGRPYRMLIRLINMINKEIS